MNKVIGNSWDNLLQDEFRKPYFKELEEFVDSEYQSKRCFPKEGDIFNAFRYTDFEDIKVIILGQDPYHGLGQAMGLCFSVPKGIPLPPSLQNIYKEMSDDINLRIPKSGDISPLTEEGVFMLNTTLTVQENKPLSHINHGWERFTDYCISLINEKKSPVVFMLWGNNARSKKRLITNPIHLVIESAHPSPLSAYNGFFGSKPFSKTNDFLMKNGIKPIKWRKIEDEN